MDSRHFVGSILDWRLFGMTSEVTLQRCQEYCRCSSLKPSNITKPFIQVPKPWPLHTPHAIPTQIASANFQAFNLQRLCNARQAVLLKGSSIFSSTAWGTARIRDPFLSDTYICLRSTVYQGTLVFLRTLPFRVPSLLGEGRWKTALRGAHHGFQNAYVYT